MNGVLNSEVTLFQSYNYAYTESNCLQCKDNFSDLVPFSITVESVLNNGYYSFNLINPMTARTFSKHAVVMNSFAGTFTQKTGLNILGAGIPCAPTVTFNKNIGPDKCFLSGMN